MNDSLELPAPTCDACSSAVTTLEGVLVVYAQPSERIMCVECVNRLERALSLIGRMLTRLDHTHDNETVDAGEESRQGARFS